MRITLKTHNPTGNGANNIETFANVKEAKKYLNEASYYSERVELCSSFNDNVEYTHKTNLSYLMRDAKIYGEGYIEVYILF